MPLEQLSNNLDFFSFFVASKLGVTGLTVTVDVWKHLTSTNTSSQIITAGSATEVGGGLYRYQLSSASVTGEGEYICIFKTSSTTPDQQHIPSIWCVQKAGSEYLDAAVTTRASATDYTTARAAKLDNLDATVSSRFPTSSWIPPATASGSISYPVTVTQSDGVTPIEGVQVWITTDLAGTNVIAGSLYTSSMGLTTFVLDAGSYYLWRQASGWNFSNPQAITVS